MGDFCIRTTYDDNLYHFGVKGMKWGVRKQRELVGRSRGSSDSMSVEQRKAARRAKARKYAKAGAIIGGTVLAAYGGYKLSKALGAKRAASLVSKFPEIEVSTTVVPHTKIPTVNIPTKTISTKPVPTKSIASTKVNQIPSKYKYRKLAAQTVKYSKKKSVSSQPAPKVSTVNVAINNAGSKPMSAAAQWNKQLKENKLGYSPEQQALLEEIFKNMPK